MEPHLSIIFGSLIWAFTGVVIKILHLPSTYLGFYRCAVPTITALAVLIYYRQPRPLLKDKKIWLASVLNALRIYFFIWAFDYLNVGIGMTICYTSPIFTSLLAWLFLKEKIPLASLLAVVLGFVGTFVVYEGAKDIANQTTGILLMLGSSLTYSFVNILVKDSLKKFNEQQIVYSQNLFGGLLFGVIVLMTDFQPTIFQSSLATIYAFLIGNVAFSLYYYGLKRLQVATAVALTYLDVFFAIILGMIFFSEELSPQLVIGLLCILSSAFIVSKKK